jgi:hypothetical protein
MDIKESQLDIGYVINKVQNILNRVHTVEAKKKIIERTDELTFACPVCGDSEKNMWKKRGNIYISGKGQFPPLHFKCWNCDSYMSFSKFCDTFNENIEIEDKIRLYNYVDNNTFYKNIDDQTLTILDKLIKIEDFIEKCNNTSGSKLYDVSKIVEGSNAHKYLTSRYIFDYSNILQGKYKTKRYPINVIILLNCGGDRMVGYQLRNLNDDPKKRFYKIEDFDVIYNFMHPEDPLDKIEAITYNKLSHFYNILNVDFNKQITIFEGFLDAKFCNNTIGLVGAGHSDDLLRFLTEADENLQLQFFYDNDKKGFEKSMQMIKRGYPVFLWNKLFERLLKGKKNKFEAKQIYKSIKDLNKLVMEAKNPKVYKDLNLEQYYSKDQFDSIYLELKKM